MMEFVHKVFPLLLPLSYKTMEGTAVVRSFRELMTKYEVEAERPRQTKSQLRTQKEEEDKRLLA